MSERGARIFKRSALAVDIRVGEAPILGIGALLVGWLVSGRGLQVSLIVALVLDGLVMWGMHRVGWSAAIWLSLPVLGIIGWVLAGSGPVMMIVWPVLTFVSISVAALIQHAARRLWVSSAGLLLILLGVALARLPMGAWLGVMTVPRLLQWRLRAYPHRLWVEWVVLILGSLLVGYWIQFLIR